MEKLPDEAIEVEIEVGKLATKFLLSEAPLEFWWVKDETSEIPRFGSENLGAEF